MDLGLEQKTQCSLCLQSGSLPAIVCTVFAPSFKATNLSPHSLKSLSGFHSLQNKAGMPKHGEQALCGLALLTALSSPLPYTPATWNNSQLPNWPCIPYVFGRAAPFSSSPLICSACCLYSANSVLKDFDPRRSHSHILKDVRQNTSAVTF